MDTGGIYLGDVSSLPQEIVSGQPQTSEPEQQNETNSSANSTNGVGEQIDVYA